MGEQAVQAQQEIRGGPLVSEGHMSAPYVIEVRATERPCSTCGAPVQPGQLYVTERSAVRHIGCRA